MEILSNFTTLLEKQINTKIQSPREKIKYNKITTYLGDYSKCSCCGTIRGIKHNVLFESQSLLTGKLI